MRKTTTRRTRPDHPSNRGIGSLPWSYFVVIAICGCIVAAGFLLAARQHFVSMDLGMKNSKLRKQLDELETENRRLMLAREVALSPVEITKTAKNLGFVEMSQTAIAVPVIAMQPAKQSPKPTTGVTSTNGVERISYQRPTGSGAARTGNRAATAPYAIARPDLVAIAR